ncbi:hypothetical protein TRFO_20288 [Tritrichomonas foetus]|uniref:Protein kinase domain-containing protein n=1 Tax=Tritrichomonas foetus TaxID=1144522 RepID=A0A1J4KM14_9EUKA|nr:hypothetical protein TRFO_20288 [Tritrichomonas foetus]|eukprot:OHT10413.1 hypothetical protein TRFO_20288 [Tritrichomonas foetus]
MGDLLKLSNLLIDPTKYKPKNILIRTEFANYGISVVTDETGKNLMESSFQIDYPEDEKNFFRNISFQAHCEHPLISKLIGYSFFNREGTPGNFLVISEYPENGFLSSAVEKAKMGILRGFNNTAKSKFIFGAAIIGSFLHSRGIIHRCFAPPSFGVSKDFEAILCVLTTSKSGSQNINETVQFSNICWIAPEFGFTDFEDDPNYYYAVDVFSFGSLLYYLYTGEVPFSDKSFPKIAENKRNAEMFIPDEMPPGMKDLLMRCWSYNPKERPQFSEIVMSLQIHHGLFPKTDLHKFDEYVKRILAIPVASPVCKLASQKLVESVNTIYDSVITNYKMKYDPKVLNALYSIREQVQSYAPLLVKVLRGGSTNGLTIKVPSFMFSSSLSQQITGLMGLPEMFQKIEINDEKTIDVPFLTLEQLGITNGSTLRVFNNFGNLTLASDLLNLDIQYVGKVSIAYMQFDTIQTLMDDIHFLTRIPLYSMILRFHGKVLNGYSSEILTSANNNIHKNDLIEVTTSYPNNEFNITVDLIGFEEKASKTVSVTPLMKIVDFMRKLKVNTFICFVTHSGHRLSPYKAFLDYFIVSPTTVVLHMPEGK